ncbi:MAG: hypothetical protein KatS3mg102_1389 [Planctomycetota bacterium]|nr:MAG: hypothetical protein KatS3mg102_1389 [Planctomycetota bacterium]
MAEPAQRLFGTGAEPPGAPSHKDRAPAVVWPPLVLLGVLLGTSVLLVPRWRQPPLVGNYVLERIRYRFAPGRQPAGEVVPALERARRIGPGLYERRVPPSRLRVTERRFEHEGGVRQRYWQVRRDVLMFEVRGRPRYVRYRWEDQALVLVLSGEPSQEFVYRRVQPPADALGSP